MIKLLITDEYKFTKNIFRLKREVRNVLYDHIYFFSINIFFTYSKIYI